MVVPSWWAIRYSSRQLLRAEKSTNTWVGLVLSSVGVLERLEILSNFSSGDVAREKKKNSRWAGTNIKNDVARRSKNREK